MKGLSEFCTCSDKKCPLNPVNHEKGCSLCINKCLNNGEIPSCFFNAVDKGAEKTGYTYKEFAEYVFKNEKG